MKKLLCAVLAIVTLAACLVGFKANEEKPLPVYREVEDIPQKGNLVVRSESHYWQPPYVCIDGQIKLLDENNQDIIEQMEKYEEYLFSRNIPETLPEKELVYEVGKFGGLVGDATVVITNQAELECYFATLIAEDEARIERMTSRQLTASGHLAVALEGAIKTAKRCIDLYLQTYYRFKETIDFETQTFVMLVNGGSGIKKILIEDNLMIVLYQAGDYVGTHHCLLIDKADLPANGNDLEIVSYLERPEVYPYNEYEGYPYCYNGRVTFPPRIFFDPVAE